MTARRLPFALETRLRRAPNSLKAALLMVGAVALFATLSTLVRLVSETLPPLMAVFFRNFFGLIAFAPLFWGRGLALLRTKRFGFHVARSVVGLTAMTTGFLSLSLLPLAEATALGFTAPLFATLGAALALGERIRAHRISALAVGFVGVLIVLQPGGSGMPGGLGATMALICAIAIAVSTLMVKRMTETEAPETIAVWMMVLMTPMSLIPALVVWETPDLWEFGLLAALATCGSAAHLMWTRAWTLSEVGALQPFEFLKLPLTAFGGWLLFSETPGVAVWVGGVVIFAAVAYIAHREARAPASTRPAGGAGVGLEARTPPTRDPTAARDGAADRRR